MLKNCKNIPAEFMTFISISKISRIYAKELTGTYRITVGYDSVDHM